MRVCVLFYNLGGYHLARLQAARAVCGQRRWEFAAIQIAETTTEHPWGKVALPQYVTTLMPFQAGEDPALRDQDRLVEALDELNPGAVAVPGWGFDFARTALKWCRRHGRIAVLMSESKVDDSPRTWWKEFAKRMLSVRHFAAGIVGGEKHRDYLIRLGMPKAHIFTGYDVVDNPYFVDRVDRFRVTMDPAQAPACVQGRRYMVAVNRFIPRKNLTTLIQAFRRFRDSNTAQDDWDLVLLGDGSQKEELQQLTEQLNLTGRVHFPGFQPYAEICRWYAFAEIFIHPALSEQWGLVVNEAMASGLPVLLSKACGCYPDLLLEGQSGFSFEPSDEQELADKMLTLAQDESLRRRMGIASREHILKNYAPERFGDALLAAIDSARRVSKPQTPAEEC